MKEVFAWRQTLFLMVKRDIELRIKGTSFGIIWLLMQPIFLLAVYSFVFSGILNVSFRPGSNSGDFALYLFAALVPFGAFQESITRASSSLIENRELLLKSQMPMWLFPVIPVLSSLVTEILGLIVMVAALLIMGYGISFLLIFLPLLVFIRLLFSLVFAPLVAVLSVYFRDIIQLIPLLLTAWFFATPIIYPVSMIPVEWQSYMLLNPMANLVEGYRAILIDHAYPTHLFSLLILLLVLLPVNFYLFSRLQTRAKDFL
jgi:ABC-type polysaccharide/polyol phosphate export permease